MDEQAIRAIIREVLQSTAVAEECAPECTCAPSDGKSAAERPRVPLAPAPAQGAAGSIPLEVSARHVHLTREDVEKLFGKGAALTKKRDLSQPGEFLSEQRVKLITPKGVLENVAVLGPARDATQVELSLTDCRALDIQAPVNLSGDLTNAGDVMLAGTCGCMSAPGSVIAARAHIHMPPSDAQRFGVTDGAHVRVALEGARPLTLDDVIVRVRADFALACHIDFDEANAAGASCGTPARIVGQAASPIACAAQPVPAGAASPQAPLFDGKLVTEEMARAVRRQGGEVRVKRGVILTPAAKDVFSNAHMRITQV